MRAEVELELLERASSRLRGCSAKITRGKSCADTW